jgi:hypothetical protein
LTIQPLDMLGCLHGLFWTMYRWVMSVSTTQRRCGATRR